MNGPNLANGRHRPGQQKVIDRCPTAGRTPAGLILTGPLNSMDGPNLRDGLKLAGARIWRADLTMKAVPILTHIHPTHYGQGRRCADCLGRRPGHLTGHCLLRCWAYLRRHGFRPRRRAGLNLPDPYHHVQSHPGNRLLARLIQPGLRRGWVPH